MLRQRSDAGRRRRVAFFVLPHDGEDALGDPGAPPPATPADDRGRPPWPDPVDRRSSGAAS